MADISFLNHPLIKNLHPRKLEIMKDLIQAADNQPIDKALPLLLSAQKKLKQENLSFTKEESELISNELMKNISQTDKMKLEMLKKMMSSKKK